MRCKRCRREISGIGKPALPPALAVVIAFAGSILGLFNLTLGQDPANALPNWSPVTGWGIGLGSLALATVLAWFGLVRRKCPDCGSIEMLDAMEEEALQASERAAAVKAAVEEARAGRDPLAPRETAPNPRAAIEADFRAAQAKEAAEKLASLEKELRADYERQNAENERVLRKKLEEELKAQVDLKVRAEVEKQQRANMMAAGTGMDRPVTPAPVTTAKAVATSTAQRGESRPVTPAPVTTAKAVATSTAPKVGGRPVTPAPITKSKAVATSTGPSSGADKPVTPAPATTENGAASTASQTSVSSDASQAESKAAAPAPASTSKTAQPATAQAKVETAPLALMGSTARATVRHPAAAVFVGVTPPPQPTGLVQPTPPVQPTHPPIDGHERAKRRARVILSDLSAYHRDELLKAANAPDPKKELGPLWRDAVISYNEVALPEIRSVTNYLEEELDRYLTQLRSD